MIILIAILLLLFTPAVMLVITLLRRKQNILWLLAMLGSVLAWPAVYIGRNNLPQEISLLKWQPAAFFPVSPTLLVDSTSWFFAIALATLLLAIMLTSSARIGLKFPQSQTESPDPNSSTQSQDSYQKLNWRAWAANLALTSLGIVAVLAGNLLTIMLAWAALDIIEAIILLGLVSNSVDRRQVIINFSSQITGIALLCLAGIVMWYQDGQLDFNSITPPANLFLLLAAGIRLGIFPLRVPLLRELPLRIGLGTVLRMVQVAASLAVLVRSAEIGIPGIAGLVLLGFTGIAGLIGGIGWLRSSDELSGRSYWILATTALATAATIMAQPTASLAWGLATILPGSLIFISSERRRQLAPIILIGALCLTGLPFTPVWAGSIVFQPRAGTNLPEQIVALLLGLSLVTNHALILAGFLRHGLRGIFIPDIKPMQQFESWVWLLYPPGLLILPVVHILLGWLIIPSATQASFIMWAEGACALGLAAAAWYFSSRPSKPGIFINLQRIYKPQSLLEKVYRSLYRPIGWLVQLAARTVRVSSVVLEGEAGILWALVLLVLILVFLQQG